MELTGDEVRVLGDLDDLDELLLGPDAGDVEAVLLQRPHVVVVHLEAVAMTLLDDPLTVETRGAAALFEDDRVETEPHRAALVGEATLLGQEVDDRMRRVRIELRGIRAGEPAHVPRVLDHRALQTETDAEERHALLAGVSHRLDLAFDAAIPESAGHENAVDVAEVRRS